MNESLKEAARALDDLEKGLKRLLGRKKGGTGSLSRSPFGEQDREEAAEMVRRVLRRLKSFY